MTGLRCLLFVLVLASSSVSWGFCKTNGHDQNQSKAGRITYSLGDKFCQSGGACHETIVKESDRCEDAKTLIKFSCTKGQPVEKKIICKTSCEAGRCL